ncbi:SAF domain-containing protein [Parenemella sanctibonifatiensis]|uniref:SAF domain-containing protein n=1 Tax=Parenemella sanctibonifatiensis TaxID=2016505 RepID=A0A255EGK3_9ACTN|nr:SAF domain-containing protein [Parenemella sanctibonifatiensis]OYN90656.1 hypothetical protein CGZ92_00460 [Parenemella sanctibonifatiensis]
MANPSTSGGRRRPTWIAAGVLAICLGGLGGGFLYSQAVHTEEVLAITERVSRGEVIEAEDLRVVPAGELPGVDSVPASQRDSVIGTRAATDLPRGSLLTPDSLSETEPRPGMVQVGLRLTPGRTPTQLLPAGTAVTLIIVAAPGSDPTATTSGSFPGTTAIDARPSEDGSAVLVDVWVTAEHGPTVAELAATDRLALITAEQS